MNRKRINWGDWRIWLSVGLLGLLAVTCILALNYRPPITINEFRAHNPVIDHYRQKFPNDPRTDAEVMQEYINTFGWDKLKDYDGFKRDSDEMIDRKYPLTIWEKLETKFPVLEQLSGWFKSSPKPVRVIVIPETKPAESFRDYMGRIQREREFENTQTEQQRLIGQQMQDNLVRQQQIQSQQDQFQNELLFELRRLNSATELGNANRR